MSTAKLFGHWLMCLGLACWIVGCNPEEEEPDTGVTNPGSGSNAPTGVHNPEGEEEEGEEHEHEEGEEHEHENGADVEVDADADGDPDIEVDVDDADADGDPEVEVEVDEDAADEGAQSSVDELEVDDTVTTDVDGELELPNVETGSQI